MSTARLRAEDVIVMPKFEVKDFPDLPARETWRYARTPTLEILSDAPDPTTQRVIRPLQEFGALVDLAAPTFLDRAPSYPVTVVICGTASRFRGLSPSNLDAVVLTHDRERLTTVVVRSSLGGLSSGEYDELFRSWILSRLSDLHPRYPAWFEEGMAQLLAHMRHDGKQIVFNEARDPVSGHAFSSGGSAGPGDQASLGAQMATAQAQSVLAEAQAQAARKDTAAARSVGSGQADLEDQDFFTYFNGAWSMPLDKLFAVAHGAPETRDPSGTWSKECWAFTDFCLYGDRLKHREATAQFLKRAVRQPDTDLEPLFRQCFGKSYHAIGAEFRGYLGGRWVERARLPKEPASPPPLDLRQATDAEVGRIKGNVLLASGRINDAHLQYLAPYIRGETDPALLASLGLLEASAPQYGAHRAEALLGAAVRARVDRPQAYIGLARLRMAEGKSAPAGGNGRLSRDQALPIVSLLLAARALPPLMPETYELLAETWDRCAAPPTATQVAILVEGARLFPDNLDLVAQAATTCADSGFSQAAAQIASLGMNGMPGAAAKARLEQFTTAQAK